MGCTYSHVGRGSARGPQRVFKVLYMDMTGNEHNPGKIEISETELVLRQRNKPAHRWPLRSLRRYGFDAELFSFESGRRCPSGPGIYAFKCQRAEALFNLLQQCIQRAGQEPDPAAALGGTLAATAMDNVLQPTDNINSLHLYVNSSLSMMADAVTDAGHEYINTDTAMASSVVEQETMVGGRSHRIQYVELDLPDRDTPSHSQGPDDACSDGSPVNMYMNMPALPVPPRVVGAGDAGSQQPHSYANLGLLASTTHAAPAITAKPTNNTTKMNYIELDLQEGMQASSSNNTVCQNGGLLATNGATSPTDSYAMIDFHKTAALNAKSTAHDEGERKTRHNSNIDDLLISE